MMDQNAACREIIEAIEALRTPPMNQEYDLHAAISAALTERGIEHIHEARIAPGARIDFLAGTIGIEVKIGKPAPKRLRRQLEKYLESDRLEAIIVVTERTTTLPDTIRQKRVVNISLNRLWGVALP